MKPPEHSQLVIAGAGAAGLAAAIFSAEKLRESGIQAGASRIALLDGAAKVGRKILISGGGRCNITHDVVRPADFNGNPNVVRNILAAFDEQAARRWFESLGVRLKVEETGKLFPVRDRASDVLGALLNRARDLDVSPITGVKITGVSREAGVFRLTWNGGVMTAERLMLCTGGKTVPSTGSDGGGYQLAQALGHTVTKTYPALVPLLCAPEFFHHKLSGVSTPAELKVIAGGKTIAAYKGDLLFTHFGISGPVAMDISRHWIIARDESGTAALTANFAPGEDTASLDRRLAGEARAQPGKSAAAIISRRLPYSLSQALALHAGVDPEQRAGQLTRTARAALAKAVTALDIPVTGPRGWNHGEVTAGGVPLHEINFRTMESRIAPGLYFAGEILDVDGRIGGYNFQWAWSTGFIAGRAAAAAIAAG
ncbi:MAG: hypothetical protein GMKNLPBB_03139 [Myxococcota bacterium]|nr:hypothetical protein [Myxococcota bacterium]